MTATPLWFAAPAGSRGCRAVGGFGPIVVGSLAAAYSFQVAIALLAGIYVLDMFAMIFLVPERKGAELA